MAAPPLPCEPLLFDRIPIGKVWGGRRLEEWFSLSVDSSAPIGETWELSDVSGFETRVRGGGCHGFSLRQLMERHGPAILGRSTAGPNGRFPLLVKFIDAAQDLSVQIHPPDGPKSPTGVGKTEAWFVLRADKDAKVICGLQPGVTPMSFREAMGASGIESLLHHVPVQRGDVLFVPAGQIHAILGGVQLIEIQQTSDITYRVWDWNRPDPSGNMRELHVERALDVMDHYLAPGKAVQAQYRKRFVGADSAPLGNCPYFDLTAVKITGEHTHHLSGFATTVSVVGGAGKIAHPEGKFQEREIQFGDVFLVPGTLDGLKFIPGSEGLELLEGFAR
ncbi:MAG TPA: type I phosphomannose isomerase catalytic subunit [Planctomycetota bacterium]|nr:hypothetical protein [Planctomycetota bacterium]MDP6129709.1 class I mannose-6-phosphate isomerase [Planctomycetota bacterium]MDP7245179.1 class I mannose-6-phosphate isomerase [Planctomycetota bacterium]HJM39456.1 type I phosphomannose isomerase catalytic subunit [Planctomycetota bacterium]